MTGSASALTEAARDGVAIVTIDNPPVNALSPQTVAALTSALQSAQADPAVVAIVLTGANGTFSAGADLRSLTAQSPPPSPARDLIAQLDASTKPIVAAIDGNALGGGLEVALACDYRIASERARFAFPEILRGLIPGAGGTQRLPRMIGTGAALEFILTGAPISPPEAKRYRMIDAIAATDLLDDAVAFARARANDGRRSTTGGLAEMQSSALDTARIGAPPADRGGLAHREAIEAVSDATKLPFAQGYARERERLLTLLASEQSQARIHLFFAQRRLEKRAADARDAERVIADRLLAPYLRAAEFLLEEGSTPRQVDRVMREFGFAMGPLTMADNVGLDVVPTSRIGDALREAGRLGHATRAGFYRYRDSDRTPVADPHVDDLAERLARLNNVAPRLLSDREIRERCCYALVHAGATLLADGTAQHAGDIDVVSVREHGFPAFRGGPMWWADRVGLPTVVAALDGYARVYGDAWAPPPLLRELAAGGGSFDGWERASAR